jgi:hypothetical protein
MTLSRKNPSQKGSGGVAQGIDPKFKPQYIQKKKLEKENNADFCKDVHGVIRCYMVLE